MLASTVLFVPAASAINTEADAWFMGTWAVACDRTVADENPLAVFFRAPKTGTLLIAVVSRNHDSLASSITQVFTRSPVNAGRLDADFDHAEGGVNRAVLAVTPDSFRVTQTTRPDGQVTTRNGVVVATGKPTLTYQRCSPKR